MAHPPSTRRRIGIAFDIHASWFEHTLAGLAAAGGDAGGWSFFQADAYRTRVTERLLDGLVIQHVRP